MSSFINKEIDDLIKGLEGLRSGLPLSAKIKNQDFTQQMIELNKLYEKIINNSEYLKCILVLGFKKVTWKNELRDKFDISTRTIEYFIYNMKSNGLIITKTLTDIDNILYETIIRMNSESFYRQSHNINLMTLSVDGEEFFKKLLEDSLKIQRQDITSTIQEILNKTTSFKKAYHQIEELEDKISYDKDGIKIIDGYRHIKYPDGTLILKETEKHKQLQLEIKKGILEHKQEQGLLTHKQQQQLLILGENKGDLVIFDSMDLNEDKSVYKGIFSHLNSIELDNMVDGVTKEEEKLVEKEYNEHIKQKIKYYNENSYDIRKVLNKIAETDEEELKNKKECLNLLNSFVT